MTTDRNSHRNLKRRGSLFIAETTATVLALDRQSRVIPNSGTPPIVRMTAPKDFTKGVSLPTLQGEGLYVTIVRTRWNDGVVSQLLEGCLASLDKCGVKKDNISVVHVPGAFEVRMDAPLELRRAF